MDTPTVSAGSNTSELIRFAFVQRPGLLKLVVVNALLGLVTLGIYRFWGKTKIRQHIWSSVHLNGEPLEYTGTGKELFKGFLVVTLLLGLPIAVVSLAIVFAQGPESPLLLVLQGLVALFIYVFLGFAIYKARKYQLSRTLWRGIRGTLVGSAMTYSLTFFGSLLAKAMSLGWATPVMNTVLQEQIISDMRFGDAAFKFRGRAGPLYPTYALCWFLTLIAIVAVPIVLSASGLFDSFGKLFEANANGSSSDINFFWTTLLLIALAFLAYMLVFPMLWAIYQAKELRTFANYTRFDGVPFKLNVKATEVIGLTVINLLILVLTLGFGQPFVQRRTIRFIVERLQLEGAIEIDRIRQSSMPLDTRGEGLADAFDVGGF